MSTTTSCPAVGQPDGTSNAGCEDADFAGFTGDIALIQRGTCFFYEKIANAVEAGAEAVIIFNEGNSEERSAPTSVRPAFPQDVPVVEMSAEAGAALVEFIEAEAAAGRQVTLTVTTSTISEVRESENVIAQTTTGRTDAWSFRVPTSTPLSRVPASTTTARDRRRSSRSRCRWPSWGSSPATSAIHLVRRRGSRACGFGLLREPAQQARTQGHRGDAQLRHGWLAQPGLVRLRRRRIRHRVHGSIGSGVVEDVFVDFFDLDRARDRTNRVRRPLRLRRVRRRRIPAGGLFTGAEDIMTAEQAAKWDGEAGVAFDPCYHQACDTLDNVDLVALDEMTDAIAHAILTFAMTTSAVEGTGKGNEPATTTQPSAGRAQ